MASHPQLPPSQHLHAWDLLLLLNLVTANSSYRGQLAGQQAWVPLCLPKSAPDCFHFVYVHYPSSSSPLFIALVGRNQQAFFETHAVREPLMATLESTGVLEVWPTMPAGHRLPLPPALAAAACSRWFHLSCFCQGSSTAAWCCWKLCHVAIVALFAHATGVQVDSNERCLSCGCCPESEKMGMWQAFACVCMV